MTVAAFLLNDIAGIAPQLDGATTGSNAVPVVAASFDPIVSRPAPVAIIPAHNEERTVADVVRTVALSGAVERLLVVDDDSNDGTASAAEAAGAEVLSLRPNRGKGGAMIEAVMHVGGADPIAFFDADLTTLRPEHVRALVYAVQDLGYEMACGLCGGARLGALIMPSITGQRVVRRRVLSAVPPSCWSGYSIEVAMNDAARRIAARSCIVPLHGLAFRDKTAKTGWIDGMARHVVMFSEIVKSMRELDRSGTCRTKRCTRPIARA